MLCRTKGMNDYFKSPYEGACVILTCGLGNRLNVINSFGKYNINYYWNIDSSCGADFTDLFEKNNFVTFKNQLSSNTYLFSSENKKNWYSGVLYRLSEKPNIKIVSDKLLHLNDNVNMILCTPLINTYDFSFYGLLKPSKSVNNLLKTFFKSSSPILGLHVRYSDNVTSKLLKSADSIISDIVTQSKLYPNHNIFIASDNNSIKNKVIKLFPTRILYQNININQNSHSSMVQERSTKQGMIESVADLFALSKCDILWGNDKLSTFFIAANHIKNS